MKNISLKKVNFLENKKLFNQKFKDKKVTRHSIELAVEPNMFLCFHQL